MDKTTLDGAQAPASDPRLLFDIPGGGVSLGQLAQAVRQSLMPTGGLIPFAGPTAPLGYLLCDGAAMSRQTYAALFAVLGTAYGVGDGSTTFNLPDLRGRIPVGKNAGTFTPLGATGGEETHALTTAEAPSHTHTSAAHTHTMGNHTHTGPSHTHTHDTHGHALTDTGHTHNVQKGGGSGGAVTALSSGTTFSSTGTQVGAGLSNTTGISLASTVSTEQAAGTGASGAPSNNTSDSTTPGATGATGSGTAHNNLQPYQVVNYIIKT